MGHHASGLSLVLCRGLQSGTQSVRLINTGCRDISAFFIVSPFVCSCVGFVFAVSPVTTLSPCHVGFLLNIFTMPVSCNLSFFLCHSLLLLRVSRCQQFSPPTHTHSLPSWVGAGCLLSMCINIYLPSCPMSPVNTLSSLRNAIITSYSRGTLNPKSPQNTSECQHSFFFFTTPIGCWGRVFEAVMTGDLGFCEHQALG